MGLLTIRPIVKEGLDPIVSVYETASLADLCPNDGRTFLHYKNLHAVDEPVLTLDSQVKCDQGVDDDIALGAIPVDTGELMVGPFDRGRFNNENGNLVITTPEIGKGLKVTENGAGAVGGGYQEVTVEDGETYVFTAYFKKGTAVQGAIHLGTTLLQNELWDSGPLTDVAWTKHTKSVVASGTSIFITLWAEEESGIAYFDGISLRKDGIGAELVANGEFDTDTTGWTLKDAILAVEAGGAVTSLKVAAFSLKP